MSIPQGVTVRPMGEPRPVVSGARNVLEAAAMMLDRDGARRLIEAALGMENNSALARIHLSDPVRWSKISQPSRLMEIANWLKAECFECMDLVEMPAVDTRGD